MTDTAASPPALESALLPHDLSPWTMFTGADWVVQAVMIGLFLASVTTWSVWILKTWDLRRADRRIRALIHMVSQARSLIDAARSIDGKSGPEADLLRAAMDEARKSAGIPGQGLKDRVAIRLERVEAAAARRMNAGMGVLATIGSVGPFVGLFGTVWGIMNSFVGISKAQTTNLAVVAPGIAEALLATAIGLAAAIPAVVIYNGFARVVAARRALLGDAAALVLNMVGRDLDRRVLPLHEAAE